MTYFGDGATCDRGYWSTPEIPIMHVTSYFWHACGHHNMQRRGTRRFAKGWFGRCNFTPETGVKVHLPRAILPLERAKACGGCAFTPKRGVKVHSPKPPFCKSALLFPNEAPWSVPHFLTCFRPFRHLLARCYTVADVFLQPFLHRRSLESWLAFESNLHAKNLGLDLSWLDLPLERPRCLPQNSPESLNIRSLGHLH